MSFSAPWVHLEKQENNNILCKNKVSEGNM